jgi:hypothetical protein
LGRGKAAHLLQYASELLGQHGAATGGSCVGIAGCAQCLALIEEAYGTLESLLGAIGLRLEASQVGTDLLSSAQIRPGCKQGGN